MRITSLKNILAVTLLACATTLMGQNVRKWDFTNWSEETVTNLKAVNASNTEWSDIEKVNGTEPTELSKENCFWQVGSGTTDGLTLSANSVTIKETEGLLFTHTVTRSLAIAVNYQTIDTSKDFGPYNGASYLWFGSKNQNYVVIPNVKAGATIKIGIESHKITDARGVELYVGRGNSDGTISGTKLNDPDGNAVSLPTTYVDQTWLLPAEGLTDAANEDGTYDVTIRNTNGCHLYYIEVTEPASEGEGEGEGGEVVIPENCVEIGTIEAEVDETKLVDINNCRQKAGQLIDSSYDGSYVTFNVNTTTAGKYLFTSMIGTTQNGTAITVGYLDANGEYVVSEKKDIENSGNWNQGPNYTWTFDLEANKVYTFKILCHTATGSGYCVNLFAMNIGMEGMVTPEYTVSYSLGDVVAEGVLPATVTLKQGKTIIIPANTTIYAEGKTLTGWTDGTNTYKAGDEITIEADLALTAVFADNEVSLADRTEAVSIKWYFGEANGAGTVNAQGKSTILVAQATVNGKVIDVKMNIDATNGKANNVGRGDTWAQINGGTIFSIPSCKGATVSMSAWSDITATTIEGSTDYTPGKSVSYTVVGEAESLDIVVNDGSYYSEVAVVLPVVKSEGGEDTPVEVAWRDMQLDLISFLTDEEKAAEGTVYNFGVAIAEDGTATRVAADDASANAVINGKYHNSHGFVNLTVTVAVKGNVKIGTGNCSYGTSSVKVTDSSDKEVAAWSSGGDLNGNAAYDDCWISNKENVVYGYYTGGEATTLTISVNSYCPYISVEAFEEVITEATVTYSLGDVVCEGSVVPAAVKVVVGTDKVTVPANFTLYVEGKTLTGWTDGTTTYAIGAEIEPTADITLTPVFTDNAVSLADRKDAVTVKWDFRRDNGAPIVGWEGKTGLIWVTQAVVNGETIDVKLDFSTSPGKFNNSGNTDCIQVNNGTTFTIPSCKGTVVSMECHGSFSISTTTIDGQSDYTAGSNVSYTVANEAETIDIVIGDGSYYKYIQAVLPFVEKSYAGTVFENAEACITWPFNNATDYATAYTSTPEGAFAVISANVGDIEVVGTGTGQAVDENGNKVEFVKLQPSGSTQAAEWSVTPAKGLTFTPTKVTGYIQRFGTDSENGVTVTAMLADGTSITLGNYTAPRNNKSQADDKFGASANYTNQFVIELTEEQQATLTSADGFTLSATVGVGATKQGGFSDVRIYGTVNGTVADVAKYAVAIASNIEEAGSVSIYPVSAKYDEGTEVTLTAVEDFGYNFVNWTNVAGEEVSTDSKFVWTVSADETLTANFVQVNTYELAMAINGGANDYMISYNPAPTIVDGKQMYEEGAEVTLIAASNEILDFNSWSNGETSSEIKVVMNENISLAADYSADDYVVGWDFYRAGGNGRVADFYSTSDNEATQLVLINEAGTTQGWLDKSTMAANGYESMKGAAVNWKPLGEYYYQTKLNAKDFTNLQVKSQLLCNYNAYSRISLDWSLDGQTWTSAGEVTLETVKVIYDLNVTLPAEADHAETLYLRWKPDLTSAVVGTEALANDGTAISNIFVLADAAIYDDGVAPKLLSTVPAEGATNASANGRVVLNFDEKVKLNEGAKATLNGEELTLAVSGKTVTAEYKGLTYSTNYSFELTANAVSDLAGNTLVDAIKIDFATMTKPTVTKALYDFIVPDDGNFKEALEAAAARADKGKRYRIFVKQGAHIIPANAENMVTGLDGKSYPDPKTYFNTPNVSIIGEGLDNTSVANTMPNDLAANPDAGKGGQANPLEGIRTSGVLYLQGNATNTYFEDITLKTNTPDATGRNVILVDGGNKTICKDVCLWAYQDTYVSDRGQSLYYFEGGVIRGRTDFICGSGDVFFNGVDIVMCEKGGYIVAPRDNVKYGYVFKDCTLKGETDDVNGNYFLGRSWTEAGETYYIDCVMEAIPNAGGWTNMAAGGWTRCAEYNSTTASGTVVDLSGRVTELGGNPTNPILTAEEAAEIGNMANMFGDWDPKAATEQASAPTNVKIENSVITWDNNDYVLLWAICKDGKVVDFTTEPTYTVDDATATYSVRAANEMGGLGEASIAQDPNSIEGLVAGQEVVNVAIYTTSGVQVGELQQGINIVRTTYANGVVKTVKVVVK